jgi:hypothetical protein
VAPLFITGSNNTGGRVNNGLVVIVKIFCVTGFLEQELLSLKKFSLYQPVDLCGVESDQKQEEKEKNKKTAGPAGKYMILGKIHF